MSVKNDISISSFLDYFPVVELPISLSDAIIHEISRVNKVIPSSIIAEYFSVWDDQIDDTSEFLACCQLPEQEDFHSIVYWKATLLSYEFVLATLDKKGQLIQKKVIAGIISNGTTVMQSIAKIEEDLTVHIISGEKKDDNQKYDPTNSIGYYMEILPNGQIISSKDDDVLWQEKNINKEN